MLFFHQKMSPSFFISRSKSLAPLTFSRWASLACRPLSLFLCLSLALYSKFVDMTIHPNTDAETIAVSVFVFIDSSVVSALQDAGGYAISRQNNLELHLGYYTCWLSYFTLVCLWCGRSLGRRDGRWTVTWLPSFLRWVDYFIFLPTVLHWRASRARAPLLQNRTFFHLI